jgi:CheY-like chemotaxis protein
VLARCGVTELRVVGDGEAAVAAFIEAGALPWSVIFMDMLMPLQNGPEAARAIRALEAASGAAPTWIVAVTANSGQEDRRECQEAGAQPLRCGITSPIANRRRAAAAQRGAAHAAASHRKRCCRVRRDLRVPALTRMPHARRLRLCCRHE